MKNTKRSAFTIVELVIVIAVIAILSAVLIPTFGGIIQSANIASDQTTAATLTTELQIHLQGKQIKTEAELMEALDKSGVGAKLTPKALSYGYHFWFDMENQMIVAHSAAEIKDLGSQKAASRAGGVANISFRDIYGYGYYIVDGSGTISDVLKTIDTLSSGAAYFNVITWLAAYESAADPLTTDLINQVANTIIISDAGSFYYSTASNANVAFVNGGVGTTSKHFVYNGTLVEEKDGKPNGETAGAKLPSVNSTVVIPDSMDFIGDYSLHFKDGAQISANSSKVENIFCQNSTNATINGELTVEGDKLMKGDEVVSDLTSIDGRFPYYTFSILKHDDTTTGKYAWNNGTLYVSYNEFITNGFKLQLVLTADGQNAVADTRGLVTWTVEDNFANVTVGTIEDNGVNVYNILALTSNGSAKVTAEIVLLDGTKATETFNVVVVEPQNADVTIGTTNVYVPYDGLGTQGFDWYYDGTNGSMDINLGNIEYNAEFAHTAPVITLDYDTNVFNYVNGKLELKTDANGNLTVSKNEDGTTKEYYDITVSIDGAISTVISVRVKDFTNARLVSNYNQKHNAPYFRYIGNGDVTLNRLMKLSGEYVPYDSRIVIEAAVTEGLWLPITSMSAFDMSCSGESVTPVYNEDGSRIIAWEFTGKNWENVTLNLSKGDSKIALRVKITPISATEAEDNTIILELKYVDALNVDSVSELSAAATQNVVLMSNLDITSNSTKITVGEGVTFYGNGFIINATTYKAEKTGTTDTKAKYSFSKTDLCNNPACSNYGKSPVKNTCYKMGGFLGLQKEYICNVKTNQSIMSISGNGTYEAYKTNEAFITLAGGTIDNIYINGPVYPELQYYADDSSNGANTVSTGYYVSGIKITTTGNINNSYVSGFRQPVSAQGTNLKLDNTTLEGGNYANLQLVRGSLDLKNVTTVQNPDGMASTVDTIGKLVIGLGIAVESESLQANINITGYLNQYNWVPENTDATLPTISGINLDEIFGYAFNGIDAIIIQMKISRFLEFIHLDNNGEQYFNAGFLFANIGGSADINQLSDFKKPIETNRDLVDANGFTTGSALGKVEVRLSELSGNDTVDSFIMSKFNNADGLVYVYTYRDGRVWNYSNDTVDEAATAQKYVVTLNDGETSVHPINYRGYYTNYGK